MKHWLTVALAVAVAATTAIVSPDADAKRLGGGKPAGMQRDMPARTAPDAPPPRPATPANPQQANPGTPAAAGAAAAAPKRNWMGPLAGLAAGLGIAALLSHFGLGEAAANAMMMALLVGAAIFLVMFLLRRFGGGAARGATPALAGAGAGGSAAGSPWQQPMERRGFEPAAVPPAQQPFGTGVDAAGRTAAASSGVTRAFVPAAFDSESFGRIAKTIFIRLQAANDAADLDDLRRFTTPELFASLRLDLQERGPAAQHTDVQHVESEVLDVADEPGRQIVSVRFHGRLVEDKGAAPTPFNEVWHLVKPTDGSREWTIAGIEPLSPAAA